MNAKSDTINAILEWVDLAYYLFDNMPGYLKTILVFFLLSLVIKGVIAKFVYTIIEMIIQTKMGRHTKYIVIVEIFIVLVFIYIIIKASYSPQIIPALGFTDLAYDLFLFVVAMIFSILFILVGTWLDSKQIDRSK
jgi:hypothetical protein